ncbi:MAG: hypothetical protein OMM_05357 [Candidatus Magnetoglobus multicellularis str. Araruama]|uniref:Uncharacterized protein n=1 Tax=Candidatus Magnetoglobus multicellularis str. Araruama TaxID=890399 RepID=A0A1V1NWV1_9BACT|nr:MAG: hypothetical protein OMM_05357 [Candidatus Magnetoglobus multicellularis str. Araruama]
MDSTAYITLTIDEPCSITIQYGIDQQYTQSVANTVINRSHKILLSELSENTKYNFIVMCRDESGNISYSDNNSFKTKYNFVNYFDNMEDTSHQWFPQVIAGDVSPWEIDTENYHSSTSAWHTDNYDKMSTNVLTSQAIDIRDSYIAQLTFWHQMKSEKNWDGGYLQISIDDGNTWNSLNQSEMIQGTPFGILEDNNASGRVNAWNGNISWEKVIFDISRYAGNKILLKFIMESDEATDCGENDGWYIDDLTVSKNYGCNKF